MDRFGLGCVRNTHMFEAAKFGEMRNEQVVMARANLDGGNMILGVIGEPPNSHASLRGSTERSCEFVTYG